MFTNGLLVGEILPVALTIPVVLPLLNNSWRASFCGWAAPVVLIALILLLLAPRPPATEQKTPAALVAGLEPAR